MHFFLFLLSVAAIFEQAAFPPILELLIMHRKLHNNGVVRKTTAKNKLFFTKCSH
jgi:hypothetical protein